MAGKLLRRGQEHEAGGGVDGLAQAVACYSEAASLLREYDARELGLVYMNRGNARVKAGDNPGAVEDYDRAIRLFGKARSTDCGGGLQNSLGAAWMNRGQAVLAETRPGAAREALRSQLKAIEILETLGTEGGRSLRINLGGAWLNCARAMLADGEPAPKKVSDAASRALAQVRPLELEDPLAAEISLKARHTLCAALSLEHESSGQASSEAEQALALLRHWEARFPGRFRALAPSLYRFGARLYLAREPRLLAGFLLENLDPLVSEGAMPDFLELHAIAAESLAQALSDNFNLRLRVSGNVTEERLAEQAGALRLAEKRRAELQRTWLDT